MLVDDNPVARATSAAMMHSLGWQVTQVDSGERALELVGLQLQGQHPPFQAIFVDWQMPGMDGWQTLRDVRRLYHDRTAPILVMLSAQGREHLAQRTQREQELLDGFLVKPLTTAMFRNAIAHAQGATGVIAIPRTSGNAASLRALRLNGMRILVVEDNLINQQVAQELLANEGAHITLADNGRIGVDAVAAASPPFDVVLMDLQMPVMDGLTAARAIRQELGLATLPVIAMTANAMASDREACLAAGMNDHVGKPFDLNHLVGVLMHHTHWQQAQDVLASAPAPVVLPTIQWPQGIDGEGALDRMGGNTGLLVKTLRSFARDAVHLPDKVDALLASGDIPTTRRELHGFKGLSATLGVNELSALAAQAEKLTHAGLSSPEDRVQLEMLLTQIRSGIATTMPVLESLAVQLTGHAELASSTSATSSTDGVDLTKQLHELLVLLRNSDMGAMELHALMRNSCSEDLAPILEPLDAAMAELDFHLAATECEKLIQHMTQ
jgi:CheY-like chemotaxis protein